MAGLALWPGSASAASANSDIRVALIGLGGRGRNHLQVLGKQIVVLCDVDEQLLARTSEEMAVATGKDIPTYVDYRRLLDEADIDAVSIATPNHTHALIAIAAAQAGKDVFVEKPVSHNVWEGQQIVSAARRYDRIIQCGTQARSSTGIEQAVEWVQAGGLGKILYAIGTCYKPRKSIGKLERPLQIASHLDYDLWCGPAELRELYRPKLHYDWHWDFNTGNGDLGNQGVHQLDIARWFLGQQGLPNRVLSVGGRFGYEDAGDTPNTQIAYFDYADAPLIFETRGLPRSKAARADLEHSMDNYRGTQIGVIVQCENGHVVVPDYVRAIAYDNEGQEIRRWVGEIDDLNGAYVHFANWLLAVERRDASLLTADIFEGHVSSAVCHTASISHRLGQLATAAEVEEQLAADELLSRSFARMADHLRANEVVLNEQTSGLRLGRWLRFNADGNEVLGDAEATALLRRECRKEFDVPEVS